MKGSIWDEGDPMAEPPLSLQVGPARARRLPPLDSSRLTAQPSEHGGRSAHPRRNLVDRRRRQARKHVAVLIERWGTACWYCQRALTLYPPNHRDQDGRMPADTLTVEHLTRLADGGGNDLDNLRLACLDCQQDHLST